MIFERGSEYILLASHIAKLLPKSMSELDGVGDDPLLSTSFSRLGFKNMERLHKIMKFQLLQLTNIHLPYIPNVYTMAALQQYNNTINLCCP
jgi:hypothetical protein